MDAGVQGFDAPTEDLSGSGGGLIRPPARHRQASRRQHRSGAKPAGEELEPGCVERFSQGHDPFLIRHKLKEGRGWHGGIAELKSPTTSQSSICFPPHDASEPAASKGPPTPNSALCSWHGWGADADDCSISAKNWEAAVAPFVALRAPEPHPPGWAGKWYDLQQPEWARAAAPPVWICASGCWMLASPIRWGQPWCWLFPGAANGPPMWLAACRWPA